jgi:hypothetical protein
MGRHDLDMGSLFATTIKFGFRLSSSPIGGAVIGWRRRHVSVVLRKPQGFINHVDAGCARPRDYFLLKTGWFARFPGWVVFKLER